MVASYAVNMTIRSPRFFIWTRSGTRSFFGIAVILVVLKISSISAADQMLNQVDVLGRPTSSGIM